MTTFNMVTKHQYDAPSSLFWDVCSYICFNQRLSRKVENVNISYITFHLDMLDLLGNRR